MLLVNSEVFMSEINNGREKQNAVLSVHAVVLLMMSLLVAVQGVFEIIDTVPHIVSTGCASCVAYTATIPATLLMYILFGIAIIIFCYTSSMKLMLFLPVAMIIGILPSLAYDLIFISEKGFISDGEYNVLVYLIMDIFLLLDSVVMIQFVKGTMTRTTAMICPLVYLVTGLVYFSSVFVFYGSLESTNFMGYYFCNSVTNIFFSITLFHFADMMYPDRNKNKGN